VRSGIRIGRASAVVAAIFVAVGACSTPTATTELLLISRAGPVVTKDARVTLQGSENGSVTDVGKVVRIEALPDRTVLHLAIDSAQLQLIPANVVAKITAPTAVQLILPPHSSPQELKAGQVLVAQ
jgi:phospholipid/cholesterol/gamma-HCH transport system substrate-binding protein